MAAQTKVPHLVNDKGVDKIKIGVKEFQCMGASPPFDHPHVFLDMGDETQIICPYCSTLFVYDGSLDQDESDPPSSIYVETSPPGAPAA
ncbi:zinc-finger domain-containing protein [Methyloceanibacter sp.]|uniref:zinc-finger domain-containing protein n=1 Tax=Methyloceanibacter sp. TaxID=1965321 RepID=UPI002D7170CC|nr:zinc-finger domain-containing protein [Methyloceanibacter sp.]HZP09153.1 zinc-finger domain-containing protein [Methyloceanibacter sp.]